MENRLGKFKLRKDLLRDWQELIPLMGNFVVVEARYGYDFDSILYTAYSPLFDICPEHCECPEYDIKITLDGFNPATITATKIK